MKCLAAIALLLLSAHAMADLPDTPVTLRSGEQPSSMNFYPDDSIRAREQGVATGRVTISSTGEPRNAVIDTSSGSKTLDQYGLMYATHLRWLPATHNGKPYEVTINVRVTWTLWIAPAMTGAGQKRLKGDTKLEWQMPPAVSPKLLGETS